MTATSLNLGGEPVKFLGAYVKNVSTTLGLSVNPSTANITLAEDVDFGVVFEEPEIGSFQTITVGDNWSFSGIITRFERDVSNISGKTIRVSMSDAREIMKSVPLILAPGAETIASTIENTGCSIIDVFGAYNVGNTGGLLNISGWNESGMPYNRIKTALFGGDVTEGTAIISVPAAVVNAYGEQYRFNLGDVSDVVVDDYRVNTNLVPLTNIVEDLSTKYSFDWYIETTRAADGIIDVITRTIDRSSDNINLSLQAFLDLHPDRVISATSGVELKNDIACTVLQGAPVEQMLRVNIEGMANEPIDLSAESGTNDYTMTENEIRAVLTGRQQWEIWLEGERDATGGYSRYGGSLLDDNINPVISLRTLDTIIKDNGNIPKNAARQYSYLTGAIYANTGKVYEKLKAHAEKVYGKRWVHDEIGDEIIESAWTRDSATGGTVPGGVVVGATDPNEFFRQSDGRTRAYVEFTNEDSGGVFSLGLNNLTQLFGNQNAFNGITVYGNTFSSVLPSNTTPGQFGAILVLELAPNFNPIAAVVNTDKANYTYNNAISSQPTSKTSLFVAATVDKDGVITIDAPVYEMTVDPRELLERFLSENASNDQKEQLEKQEADADGVQTTLLDKLEVALNRHLGNGLFNMSAKAYQPKYAYIPVRSRVTRYGPVFPSDLGEDTEGAVNVITDDGFAPWEFGGAGNMIAIMQLKVDNAASNQKELFSANITVEGFPQFNIGDAIDKNANINNVSISFGDSVTTQYQLQTFLRKFGEMSKEDWARVALFANSGALKILPSQQINFTDRASFRVPKQYAGQNSGSSMTTGGGRNYG